MSYLINNLVFNNELETLRRENRSLYQKVKILEELSNNIKIDPKYNYSYAFVQRQVSDLSGYDMNKCQAATYMFNGAYFSADFDSSITKNWNLNNLIYGNSMFTAFDNVVDTSNWELSNLVDGGYMFYQTTENSNFDTTRFSLRKLIYASYMFYTVDLAYSPDSNFNTSNWDLSNLVEASCMFENLILNEKSIFDTSNWGLGNLVNGSSMFRGLQLNEKSNFDTSKWDLINLIDATGMFTETNIKELNFKSWKTPHIGINPYKIFFGCSIHKLTAWGAVLKYIATNYGDIDDNTLYEVEGEADDRGLFKITKFIR